MGHLLILKLTVSVHHQGSPHFVIFKLKLNCFWLIFAFPIVEALSFKYKANRIILVSASYILLPLSTHVLSCIVTGPLSNSSKFTNLRDSIVDNELMGFRQKRGGCHR